MTLSSISCVRVLTIGFLLARVTSAFHWSGDLWAVYRSLFVCIVFPHLWLIILYHPGVRDLFRVLNFDSLKISQNIAINGFFSKYGLYVFYDCLDVMIWCFYLWVRVGGNLWVLHGGLGVIFRMVFFISFVLPHFIYICYLSVFAPLSIFLLPLSIFLLPWAYSCFF